MNLISFAALVSLVQAAADSGKPSFIEQCLKWHNHFRSKHQAPDVKWSEDLEREAQSWASHLAGYDKFEHSGNFGENLFMFQGKSINDPCRSAIQAFYDEIKFYDFNKPGFSLITGHFTQVVWKATKYIGAAQADGKDGRHFVVVRYNPAGNINTADSFRRNVLPETDQVDQKSGAQTLKSWTGVFLVTVTTVTFSLWC